MNTIDRALIISVVTALTVMAVLPSQARAREITPIVFAEAAKSDTEKHSSLLQLLVEPAANPSQFVDRRIAIVASDGASAFELANTRDYFLNRGARVDILAARPVDAFTVIGLAADVHLLQQISTVNYAGGMRPVTGTRYVDQVKPEEYDVFYFPNNLEDIRSLSANSDTIRLVLRVAKSGRPMFATGNAGALLSMLPAKWVSAAHVTNGDRRFAWPQTIDAIVGVLTRPLS